MFEEVETEVENSSHIIVNSIELDISKYKNVPSMLLNSPKPNKGKDNFINKVVNQKQKEKERVNNMEANAIKTVAELENTIFLQSNSFITSSSLMVPTTLLS